MKAMCDSTTDYNYTAHAPELFLRLTVKLFYTTFVVFQILFTWVKFALNCRSQCVTSNQPAANNSWFSPFSSSNQMEQMIALDRSNVSKNPFDILEMKIFSEQHRFTHNSFTRLSQSLSTRSFL